MKKLLPLSILALSLLSYRSISAQELNRPEKEREIYGSIGRASYSGDLGKAYSSSNLMISAGVSLNKHKKLNGNLNLSIGSITGQELGYSFVDANGNTTTPNTFVKTKFIALNYEAHYHIINKENLKVYLSQGIGLTHFTPKDEFSKDLSDQNVTRAIGETYQNITMMLPTQVGIKYYVIEKYAISFQIGFQNTLTDYLDNISEWSNNSGNDNILVTKIQFHAPISF